MRRPLRWLLGAIAAVVVVAVAAAVAVPFLVDTPRVQSLIASNASQTLGRAVHFESLRVAVFPWPAVELRGLTVGEDPRFGQAPFLALDRGELRLRVWPLLRGRVEFGDLVLHKPLVALLQDTSGRWNFASLGTPTPDARPTPARPRPAPGAGSGGGTTAAVLTSRVRLDDGVVTYATRGAGRGSRYRLEDVDVTVSPVAGAFEVKGSARMMPGGLGVRLADVTVAPGGARSLNEASLKGRVAIEGSSITELVAQVLGPEPAIAGGVKGALALDGTVGRPRASGDVEISGLSVTRSNPECPEPRRRTLAVDGVKVAVAWQDRELVARPVSGRVAGGTVTTNLVATLEGRQVELKDVAVKDVSLDTVLVGFLCGGYAVTGPLELTGAFAFSLADAWNTAAGSGQMRIGAGKVVGSRALRLLGGVSRLTGAVSGALGGDPTTPGTSPLEYDAITGTFRITGGVVTTRDLLYTSRAMKAAVTGQYALPTGRVNADVALDHARGQVQAKVTGTAASPSIQVNPSSVLRSVDPGAAEGALRELLRRFR